MTSSPPARRASAHLAVWIVPIILLVVAGAPLPYGYYTLVRFAACGAAAFIAYQSHRADKIAWTWVMGGIAVLFNPVVPFHLGREIWFAVDLAAAIVFAAHY